MEKSFAMEIVTPLGVSFKSNVTHVKLPGVEGYFGILYGHEPFITALKIGEIKADLDSGETKYFAVTGGIVEVLPNKISVLVEYAEEAHEIDIDSAYSEKERAKKILAEKASEQEIQKAKKALQHAIIRIRVAERLQASK